MLIRGKKGTHKNNDKFDDRLFIKASLNDDPAPRVLKKLKEFDNKNKIDSIIALAKHSMLPESLCRLFTRDTYYNNHSISTNISPENYIYWLIGLLHGKKDIISKFNVYRKRYNTAVLSGRSDSALELLDKIESLSAN